MMSSRYRLAALLLAIALPLASQAKPEIVIGQSAPLSKTNVSFGTDIRDGALAWFNRVNQAGGVNGHLLRLVTLDDENSADKSGPNTERLIREHGALVLFGYASATLSSPALRFAERYGIPLFAPFTGADTIHNRKSLVYTVRASYRDEMRAILRMWGGVGLTRFAVVHYDDTVGKQNFETVKQMLEGVKEGSAASIPIQRNAPVPAGMIPRLEKSRAQVIIFTTLAEPIAEIVRQLRAAHMFYHLVALSFAGNSQLRDALGKFAHGMAMATVVPRYTDASVPAVREFREAMAASGFTNLSYASFESYLAAKTLTEGLKRAGPAPKPSSFMKAMSTLGHLDLGGHALSFGREDPHGSRAVQLAVIDRNGKFKD